MNDNTENTEEEDYVIVKPQGIPVELGIMLVVVAVLSMAAGTYLSLNPEHLPGCATNDATQKAALDSQAAQIRAAEQQQKGIFALQMEVTRSCAAKGWAPVLVNGNVSCQK